MKTILCIDDSESHRFLLEEELSEEGYKVVTACSIEEFLSECREFCPDLIILELRQKNAREKTFEELKRQYPSIPLIGYSTLAQCPEESQKWIQFYLPKSCELGACRNTYRLHE